ncbi:MAG: MarR family winged helix-turn-helix transcriptional regulator [Granulosicoccus sp.]
MINSELKNEPSTNEIVDTPEPEMTETQYSLDRQIGYLLRLANQRHLEIFNRCMPELTPTQFAVIARLLELGSLSQNELGRSVGMDIATTNGVVERLQKKGLIKTALDPLDKRRLRISLTAKGKKTTIRETSTARAVTRETLKGLSDSESRHLSRLLVKLLQP